MSEHERVLRNLEPRTRLVETWWVEDAATYPHPVSFGSDEDSCRAHQAKHGGELQVIRLWETTVGQIVAIDATTPNQHATEARRVLASAQPAETEETA
jgi:hypothetical protein